MINSEINRSLKKIFCPNSVDIKQGNQVFIYGGAKNPRKTAEKVLITYVENTKTPKGKGKKYITKNDDGYKYYFDTNYWIDVSFNFFGKNAEDCAFSLIEILNNDQSQFIDNNLTIIDFGAIENLTFLENSEYKQRYLVNVKFGYTLTRETTEEAYLIKKIEFNVINK